MSEQIVERIYDAATDRRLVLKASQCARQLSIGSSWNYLRIGLRFAVQGIANVSPFRLFFGLTSGVSNVWGSATCTHALGALFNTVTATYNANSGGYLSCGDNPAGYKKVNTTETLVGGTIGGNPALLAANSAARNCAVILTIQKNGGGSFGLRCAGPWANTTYVGNKSYDLLREAIIAVTATDAATIANLASGSGLTVTGVDEGTSGALNSVCVYWMHPTIGLEISDIVVARIY